MKKILFTIVVTLVFIGCSKESSSEQIPTEVEVSLDFSFTESGSMTRAGSTPIQTSITSTLRLNS